VTFWGHHCDVYVLAALLVSPICAIKQIMNGIQLASAAQTLAKLDLLERKSK
jgi:hypothetical protein